MMSNCLEIIREPHPRRRWSGLDTLLGWWWRLEVDSNRWRGGTEPCRVLPLDQPPVASGRCRWWRLDTSVAGGWSGVGSGGRLSLFQSSIAVRWCRWLARSVAPIVPWLRRSPRRSAPDIVARRPPLLSKIFEVRLPASRTRSQRGSPAAAVITKQAGRLTTIKSRVATLPAVKACAAGQIASISRYGADTPNRAPRVGHPLRSGNRSSYLLRRGGDCRRPKRWKMGGGALLGWRNLHHVFPCCTVVGNRRRGRFQGGGWGPDRFSLFLRRSRRPLPRSHSA